MALHLLKMAMTLALLLVINDVEAYKATESNANKISQKEYEINKRKAEHEKRDPLESGCQTAGMCCQQKDNSCITKGVRMNGSSNDTCYCDSSCLALGDCCLDYKNHCPEVVCRLSQWSQWSDCDVACGFGVRHRQRSVIQEQRNGAPACEATSQKQICEGASCKKTRASGNYGEELKETARILPLKYGEWRSAYKYDPLKDIRRNIYQQLGHNASKDNQINYCALFRIEQVHPSCKNSQTSSSSSPTSSSDISTFLDRGGEVCVECQNTALSKELGGRCYGHGVISKETKWTSLHDGGKCRGTWILESRKENCSCADQTTEIPGYIFV